MQLYTGSSNTNMTMLKFHMIIRKHGVPFGRTLLNERKWIIETYWSYIAPHCAHDSYSD